MPNRTTSPELRSPEVQTILQKIPHWMIRWGNSLLFFVIGLAFALSWFISYPDTIASQAVLTTQIPPQKVYAAIDAKLDSIYVQDGQAIVQGNVLAVLNNPAVTEDVLYLKGIMDTMRLSKKTFSFPMEELPILFLGEIETSFANFENAYYQYSINKTLNPFDRRITANQAAMNELRSRQAAAEAQYQLSETEYAIKKDEYDRYELLFNKGIISEQELDNRRMGLLQAQRNNQGLGASLAQIRETLARTRNSNTDTEYDATREEVRLLKATLQAFNQLKVAITAWQDTYVFTAKQTGRVSFLNIWDENQSVHQGDLVFIVIPSENSHYLAKLRAPAQNAGKIKPGLAVHLNAYNYPKEEFGSLRGLVQDISHTPDNDGYYLVDVALSDKLVTTYNREIEFRQEMRADAEIITEDLRLLERLFYQFKTMFD